ncbi:hypothetical protein WN51_01833 [Melipona quadrifasciata]|uniref:Uncharacterized protein n=1 Tax=Melipona quadrifasciata TaxID=166423 RepID=A0A0M8ZWM4_9HYME|nr:hypothetical protein WN51_01833 [Melipona quadrifasciata]
MCNTEKRYKGHNPDFSINDVDPGDNIGRAMREQNSATHLFNQSEVKSFLETESVKLGFVSIDNPTLSKICCYGNVEQQINIFLHHVAKFIGCYNCILYEERYKKGAFYHKMNNVKRKGTCEIPKCSCPRTLDDDLISLFEEIENSFGSRLR